jgi:tRNA(Ile)-lysidine synthase
MAKLVQKKITKYLKSRLSDYFDSDAFFILGVSGGPDSMALMYLFHKLELDALIVHINYAKRGKESDKDQELVEQMAFAWGFECCSIRLDPEEAKGENFQDWARKQRYNFFRNLREDAKAEAIVTAHHQDDQIETILQKIFRGSSPTTWQGMKEWDGELFRPLLSFDKQDILHFCEAEAVPFRTDKSNESSEYARNFIRHELARKMDSLFPGWKKNVLGLTDQGKAFEASIDVITDQISAKSAISLKKYAKLPEVIKPAVWKNILDQSELTGTYSKGQLEELARIEFMQAGKIIEIGSLCITRNRDEIRLDLKDDSGEIMEEISKKQARKGWSHHSFFEITVKLKEAPKKNTPIQIDAEKLNWPLTLRTWKDGDRFHPLGMDGHQKVSDHLTNRKLPSNLKEKALVLCGSDSTIYAIIYPLEVANGEQGAISEIAKYDSHTHTFLTINFT